MSQTLVTSDASRTVLQRHLMRGIAEHLRREGLVEGDSVNQLLLARLFGVSRTPIRAALLALAQRGLLVEEGRGFRVLDLDRALDLREEADAIEALIVTLCRDRQSGVLRDEVSEADLIRTYGAPRADVTEALRRMSALGLALRKPGFGWRFLDSPDTPDTKRASFRFRLAIEPAALLEPNFRADPDWIARMRAAHEGYLDRRWRQGDSIAFFEMNAAFHLGLVSFSQNRFFVQATEQQNALRRLRNYSWRLGDDRVHTSCREHLDILDAVAAGDMAEAAERMRRHLSMTAALMLPASGAPGA